MPLEKRLDYSRTSKNWYNIKMLKTPVFKPTLPKFIFVLGIIILVGAFGAWWRLVYSNPTRVFDRMLSAHLSTPSITKTISESDDTQKLSQQTQLTISPTARVHSTNVLRQVADASTVVTTESIAAPTVDYVRYVDIKTGQKNSAGKPFDFSSVLGKWGKAEQSDAQSGGAQLFNQTALGVVPAADLPQAQREDLMKLIKDTKVYQTDMKKVKRTIQNGRPVYSYDVTVKPVAYVTVLKAFARDIGLKQLESIDASQYAASSDLAFTFDIDVWSGQLNKISYSDSQRSESYSSYGARLQIQLPSTSLTISGLQSRLQQVQ